MLTNPEEEEGVTASLEADRHRSSVLVALSRRSGRTSALPYPPLRRLVAYRSWNDRAIISKEGSAS
jgi:hypothetical protein